MLGAEESRRKGGWRGGKTFSASKERGKRRETISSWQRESAPIRSLNINLRQWTAALRNSEAANYFRVWLLQNRANRWIVLEVSVFAAMRNFLRGEKEQLEDKKLMNFSLSSSATVCASRKDNFSQFISSWCRSQQQWQRHHHQEASEQGERKRLKSLSHFLQLMMLMMMAKWRKKDWPFMGFVWRRARRAHER